jgi:RNA polymerase sigma factor (sigma-70 family)
VVFVIQVGYEAGGREQAKHGEGIRQRCRRGTVTGSLQPHAGRIAEHPDAVRRQPRRCHDIAQEAFLKCWRHREEVLRVENLRAWIYRIALNTARDNRRNRWYQRRRPLEDACDYAAADPPQPCQTEQQEFLVHLRRAIAELRKDEREVFLLRQNADLTYEEIAQLRGVPVGTVKTQMRSALAKLRQALQQFAPQPAHDCQSLKRDLLE